MDRTPPAGYSPQPALDHRQQQDPQDVGYDLQCEFVFAGCTARFNPRFVDSWIDHTLTHFAHNSSIPPITMCIFCDTVFDCSKRRLDPAENWQERMEHIHKHLQGGISPKSAKPDYFVLKHMFATESIGTAQYKYWTTYTERLFCDGLQPLGRDSVDDETSDVVTTDKPNEVPPRKHLTCPDCSAANFSSLSKLKSVANHHRSEIINLQIIASTETFTTYHTNV